jgi:acetyl-CoA carboxylase biotin carboxyl carrier protein
MELEEVRELVRLVESSGIDELEISHKGMTIRIQKSRASNFAGNPAAGAAQLATVVEAPPAAAPGGQAPTAAEKPERSTWKEIRSPIVGTFYGAPAPDAEPFVRVGDHISLGQTLCIVEAMKVMNEIEAECSGVLREILVENGQPIEAEAVLFLVDPA